MQIKFIWTLRMEIDLQDMHVRVCMTLTIFRIPYASDLSEMRILRKDGYDFLLNRIVIRFLWNLTVWL